MIVVCGGIKGGTGKTTLATNLAVLRASSGKKVLLVDSDEQKSATDWSEIRQKSDVVQFTTVCLFGENIDRQLYRLKKDYDDIVVDVGGRDTTSQRSALMIADVFLVPFKPRSLDVWTTGKLKAMISEIEIANKKLKSYCLINQADPRGADNKDALKALSDTKRICIPHFIGSRKCFCNAASEGLGISEMKKPDKIAIQELKYLHDIIYG
jgi:chromosome partitioning protein